MASIKYRKWLELSDGSVFTLPDPESFNDQNWVQWVNPDIDKEIYEDFGITWCTFSRKYNVGQFKSFVPLILRTKESYYKSVAIKNYLNQIRIGVYFWEGLSQNGLIPVPASEAWDYYDNLKTFDDLKKHEDAGTLRPRIGSAIPRTI